jgi:hypothetical protein
MFALSYDQLRVISTTIFSLVLAGSCLFDWHRDAAINPASNLMNEMFFGPQTLYSLEPAGRVYTDHYFVMLWIAVGALGFISASPYWQAPVRTPRDYFPDRGG